MQEEAVFIYLAGNIKKGHEKADEDYWTDIEMSAIRETLSPIPVVFLNPADRSDDLSDQQSVFGRDLTQVMSSDVIFVDARQRRGLGVGADWIKTYLRQQATSIKGLPALHDALTYYLKTQLQHDTPMQTIVRHAPQFKKRLEEIG